MLSSVMPPSLLERFTGCLLGHAVGDALGAPFEGLPSDVVYREFGPIRRVLANPPFDLIYTDDTEMTISVAEELVERGEVDPAALAARFAEQYDPGRCYGPGARRILEAVREGGDWQALAATIFPGGSLGNGAAMRVAPVALRFHADPPRLHEQARLASLPTHTHPVGIEGAQLLAAAIAHVVTRPKFDHREFYAELRGLATTDDFNYALKIAEQLTVDDTLGTLGHSLEAHRSVPTAIACFALHPHSYEEAICRAISLGGDTDTLAAMTGAISGAHLGTAAIPGHLVGRLENGRRGRDHIVDLARRLHALAVGE
jgi:poly(ADP-ribose) glycohydrolase ARH3